MDETDMLLAVKRIAEEAAQAEGPEDALWAISRAAPAMLGDPGAALRSNAFREVPPPVVSSACTFFMRMPDGAHHLITAPVNFPKQQYHELVRITLGHPGEVARTRRPLLLSDTALHPTFVKILQSFRAGSSMFAPLLWRGDYLGVLICANAARGSFGERDLVALQGFAGLASALWMAHGGPAWIAALDASDLPVRNEGN